MKEKETEKDIAHLLLTGGVGVLATDTLYGLVGSALRKETVERIYFLRKRDLKKPMIVLISSIDDLKIFSVRLMKMQKEKLKAFWPGTVSVVLDCKEEKFEYLHRGSNTLAFRMPAKPELKKILRKTGPLIAPSANISGKRPASTIPEAKEYFQDRVDFFVDEGRLESQPSTIIRLSENGETAILRRGSFKL